MVPHEGDMKINGGFGQKDIFQVTGWIPEHYYKQWKHIYGQRRKIFQTLKLCV